MCCRIQKNVPKWVEGEEGRRERVQGGVEGGRYVEVVKDDGVVVMKERLLQQGEERSK